MNEINNFTFYRNYYELIKYLPNEERLQMYDALLGYMFEDIDPELDGLSKGIWINLKMPLDTSKINIENGKKGGRPKNRNKTEIITEIETETKAKAKANNISTFLFLLSNFNFINNNIKLKNKLEEWLKYKWERKEYYKETGFKTLLARIDSATSQYGVEQVVNLVDECMANNYKGIIFEKLKGKDKKTKEPEWFDKDVKKQSSEETERELKELLREFK